MKRITCLFATLFFMGCSSAVQDGSSEKLYNTLPPLPPTGDPGLNNPRDPELNGPGLNLKNFIGGEYIKGGQALEVKWFLEPVDDNDEGLYSTKIEYSKDGGTTWNVIAGSIPSIGAQLMTYPWTPGGDVNSESASYKIRITTINSYGTQYTKETEGSFTIDNTAPTILDDSLKVNNNTNSYTDGQGYSKIEVNRTYMGLGFSAEDALSPVDAFCIKINSAVAPKLDDSCWKNFSLVDIEPAMKVDVPSVPAFVGFVPASFDIRLWVADKAGNISNLFNGTGKHNKDRTLVEFKPKTVPTVSRITVTNTVQPSTPPDRSQLTVKAGDSVYIKWNALPGGNGSFADKDGLMLEYTLDEETFIPVTDTPIINGNNGNCFTDGDRSNDSNIADLYTGCYVWSGATVPTGYFKIRLRTTNDVGLVGTVTSSPMNSGNFVNVAGNTDNSMGNSGETTIFNYTQEHGRVLPGSLVVTSWGRVFIRDKRYGIISIDPNDGLAKVYIKLGKTTDAVQPGEDVDVSQAATLPLRIALDYKDRLIILEKNRVRRVEKDGTISTIIGVKPGFEKFADDGLIAGDDKADWFQKNSQGEYKHLTSEGCFKTSGVNGIRAQYLKFDTKNENNAFLWPLPNGDIYFSMADSWDAPIQSAVGAAPYFGIYVEKDYAGRSVDRVYPLRLCGKGAFYTAQEPYLNFQDQNLRVRSTPGLLFNPANSYVESFSFRATQPLSNDEKPYGVTFNPRSGKSRGANTIYPNPISKWGHGSYFPGRKGELFATHYTTGATKYNASLNQWEKVFRGGIGQCEDATKASDCYVDILDFYLTLDNVPYFFDRGRVRAVVNQKVLTLFGQSRAAGNGGSPYTARFNMIEHFGVWGSGSNKKIVAYDTLERAMREIQPGYKIEKTMGNDGQGMCKKDPSSGQCSWETGFYYWGTPNAKLSNTFDATTKVGSLPMQASVYTPQYWDWGTGFVVDPANGDVYSYSSGGPLHGIARFYRDEYGQRFGQMILGNYSSSKIFLTKGTDSCDNKTAFNCAITTRSRQYFSSVYAVVVPALGKDFKTQKNTILATTHDWSYTSTNEKGQRIGSYRQCYMKALRLPEVPTMGGAIGSDKLGTTSLVQHMMGSEGECVGYGGGIETIPNTPGTVMTDNKNFPSWHSTTLPHRFVEDSDSMFMTHRANKQILKVDFVRSSVAGVGTDIITGSTVNSVAADTGRNIHSYNYKKLASGYVFYYCAGNGNLYEFRVTGSNGVGTNKQLELPTGSGIKCSTRGKTIEWSDDEKTSFYFVYTQNGLNAIGEYYIGNN